MTIFINVVRLRPVDFSETPVSLTLHLDCANLAVA